ncbi:MAG TPA: MBL fold metallo-hydrolase [Ilumatobacter sp.]|nr:MBL fold metallo-hydrolase [Ilumatobacter sp.]
MSAAVFDGDQRLIALSDEVYVFGSYPFCGVVATDAGCIAIDGPMSPRNNRPWAEFIAGLGPLRYQVYCEHHEDHIASAPFLAPEILISSQGTRTEMASTADMLASFDGWAHDPRLEPGSLDGFAMRYPTVTYSGRIVLELGGKTFELFEAPGHTSGSTVVHAVDDRVAFVADNTFTPAIQSGDPFAWLHTIDTLEALDVDWYVQGHAEPIRRDRLAVWRSVLLDAIDRAREMRASGLTPLDVVERGGVFAGYVRPDHVGAADTPPNLRTFSSTVLQEEGARRMFAALERHDGPLRGSAG